MENDETCNALKCLKPSGLIDWVNRRLCNKLVHKKCANLSKTEVGSFAEFKCSRCSLVNIIPQYHDDKFRQDTFFSQELFSHEEERMHGPLAEIRAPSQKY